MSTSKLYHCIVDDTALITNISEIEAWVLRGAIALVVPLHTLERLHLLKKDTSQIGQNARKAVKFLDDATSNSEVKVFIQEPDDQYQTWAQVEAYYTEASATNLEQKENARVADIAVEDHTVHKSEENTQSSTPKIETDGLSQMVMENLAISKANASPMSTPPLSPSSSGPQSSKASPEVKSATLITHDLSPVPPTLKGLMNPVVWYTHEKKSKLKNIVFLTNSSDTAYLARDFGVASKNIHQLRAAISLEEQEAKNHGKYQKKHSSPTTAKPASEPKTLFRYEDDESEEEEVVFKPRGRGSNKSSTNARGGKAASVRSKGHAHSPANSLSDPMQPLQQPLPSQAAVPKPQIPTEEIDPDSFDRGSFARGSTPLVSVGNHSNNHFSTPPSRGTGYRGNHSSGGRNQRASVRGFDRGSARARGRLFVP